MNSTRPKVVGLLIFALAAPLASSRAAENVDIHFGAGGLESIRQGDVSLLNDGSALVDFLLMAQADGVKSMPGTKPVARFDAGSRVLTLEYAWGVVTCGYQPLKDRLNLEVKIVNRAPDPIFHLSLRLMELNLPAVPTGKAWASGRAEGDSIDNVPAVLADYGSGALALAGERFDEDYQVVLAKTGKKDANTITAYLVIHARRTSDREHEELAVPGGGERTFTVSLRFGPANATLPEMVGDLFRQYALQHPRVLKWNDRRAISALFVASSAAIHHSVSNPRGWLNDPKLDAVSEQGRPAFDHKMLAWADNAVKILKQMDGQGMILWDLEGEQYANLTYVGEPRMLPKLAPEMDEIADQMFQRFRDAGLRTGICIRPSRILPTEAGDKNPYRHVHMKFDPAEEMSQKIDYARKRWGCTLFYMDSNATWAYSPAKEKDGKPKVDSWTMRADVLRELAAKQPDVLLIPEFQNPGYYSHVSGYKELRGGFASTPARDLYIYPDAFSVIYPTDGLIDQRRDELVASVKRGDILFFMGWYNPPINQKVKSIYEEAHR
jgi:hypothetical protein